MKKFLVGLAIDVVVLSSMATIALATPPANPGMYGTAAPNAQCGTGAMSGAFNAHNTVYGPNSSAFGQAGGAPALHNGAVGQESGATGYNNSSVCGNP